MSKYQTFVLNGIKIRVDYIELKLNNLNEKQRMLQFQINNEWIFGYFGNNTVLKNKEKIDIKNKYIKSPDYSKIWKILNNNDIYFEKGRVSIDKFITDILEQINSNEFKEIDSKSIPRSTKKFPVTEEHLYFKTFRTIPKNTNITSWSFYNQFDWSENSIWYNKEEVKHRHLMSYSSYIKLRETHNDIQIQEECFTGNGKIPVFTNDWKDINF